MSTPLNIDFPEFIKDHVARYLATDGEDGYLWDAKLGGGKDMAPTLLLTTTGRKSGRARTLPLIFGKSDRNYIVVASKAGAPAHPSWYLNLEANPDVAVQVRRNIQLSCCGLHTRFPARTRRPSTP